MTAASITAYEVDLKDAVDSIRFDMAAMESQLIKWIISMSLISVTLSSSIGLYFGLAKFVA